MFDRDTEGVAGGRDPAGGMAGERRSDRGIVELPGGRTHSNTIANLDILVEKGLDKAS